MIRVIIFVVMPKYDYSLLDFLKYASTQEEDFFPLSERIQMTKRICDGLLYMNQVMYTPHRDIKPRSVYQIPLTQKLQQMNLSTTSNCIHWTFCQQHRC